MKKKYFFIVVILVLLLGLLGYVVSINLKNNKDPLFSCKSDGSPGSCTSFNTKCNLFRGGIVTTDGHPGPYTFYDCYRKSFDAGKECASQEECVYGCDLSVALKSNKCALISNESLGSGQDGYNNGAKFFKKQYSCDTLKPGVCRELPQGGRNPGGISRNLRMEGKILVETQRSGPIY